MKNFKNNLAAVTLLCLFIILSLNSNVAFAKRLMNASGQSCEMVESATLGVNFSNVAIELKASKSFIQQKADEIMALAADLAISDITIQNMNYNIYSGSNSGCSKPAQQAYQLSGNISFKMPDAMLAEKLMEALGEKGYNVNFNMNAYRQCQ